MENIYILVKFRLNNENLIDDWKKMSAKISSDMKWNDGFIFRDSATDKDWNVYCILKWESESKQKAFKVKMDKMFEEKPEIAKEFARIVNMETMTKELLEVI